MRKINVTKVCKVLSVLLLVGFIINTIVDYSRYNNTLNSAPFYIWIIVNTIYFIVPTIIIWIVGIALKKKRKRDDKF